MFKMLVIAVISFASQVVLAEECAQTVIGNLYTELEAIDVAGEQRLGVALDELAKRETWTEAQKSDYTLAVANRPEVDAAESERTELLGELFTVAQRDSANCEKIQALRRAILGLEEQQWDNALSKVEQRLAQ
jgi:hypothetical protein